MKSFTTANLCQEIVFRDQNQNLAPNSCPQIVSFEQITAIRPARTARARSESHGQGRPIYPIDSNHPIRIKIPDLDQSKVPSPCQRLRIRLLNLTPGLTVRSALPTHSFGSLTEHGPLGPTLPSRIFRPGHAAWTESPSLAESNRLPGRAEPPSLHQKPGSNRLTLGYSTWAIHAAYSSSLPASIFA